VRRDLERSDVTMRRQRSAPVRGCAHDGARRAHRGRRV